MAGRPRTKHKRVKAVLEQLYALEGRMIALIPDQYDDTTIDNSVLPYDDLGVAWRESVNGLMSAVMRLEWLECLLDDKAKEAGKIGRPDVTDEEDEPNGKPDDSAEGSVALPTA